MMGSSVSTVMDKFPVEDITFNPKRKQSDILKEIERERPKEVGASDVKFADSGVPQIPTIERAIKYYEENAKDEYKKLYTATAIWLRKLMTSPKKSNAGGVSVEIEEEAKSSGAEE